MLVQPTLEYYLSLDYLTVLNTWNTWNYFSWNYY